MQKQNTLLVETPTNLWALFHDDPIVAKYRRILGQLVAARFLCSKSDYALISDRVAVIHRQIKGRQIALLKASNGVVEPAAEKQPVDDATLKMIFPYIAINP
jgi:hypothetical protein